MSKSDLLRDQRLLIVAPHADDEVLGCGGTIARIKDEGGKVFVLFLYKGGIYTNSLDDQQVNVNPRAAEMENAMRILSVDSYDVAYMDDYNTKLDVVPQIELVSTIEKKSKVSLESVNPTMVAIPTLHAFNQDHIAVHTAAIAALRKKGIPYPYLVLSYEEPAYNNWSPYGQFTPNFYVDITRYLDKKLEAFRQYSSQFRKGVRDDEQITLLARYRGSQVNVYAAEAFYLHRLRV